MKTKAIKYIAETYGENWLTKQWQPEEVFEVMAEFAEQNVQEHKEVIMQLLETYVMNLDENGNPKASINEILQLIDKASKLIKEKKEVCPKEYVVIADYPDSNFKIGDILRFRGITWGCNEPQKFVDNPEKYPNIFKQII